MPKDHNTPSIFTSRPADEDVSIRWEIARTPATRELIGWITCRELVGCYTHFHKGRTLPCNPQSCEACDESKPRRWHGYLSMFNPKTRRHNILEITANATVTIDEYLGRHTTLRGARLITSRRPPRINGRLIVELDAPPNDLPDLPTPPDIESVLMHMWEASWAKLGMDLTKTPGNRPTLPDDVKAAIATRNGHS